MTLVDKIAELGARSADALSNFFTWITTTSIDDLIVSLADSGFLGWLTSAIVEAFASLFSIVVGLELSAPIIDFFVVAFAGIVIIWFIDFIRKIIF